MVFRVIFSFLKAPVDYSQYKFSIESHWKLSVQLCLAQETKSTWNLKWNYIPFLLNQYFLIRWIFFHLVESLVLSFSPFSIFFWIEILKIVMNLNGWLSLMRCMVGEKVLDKHLCHILDLIPCRNSNFLHWLLIWHISDNVGVCCIFYFKKHANSHQKKRQKTFYCIFVAKIFRKNVSFLQHINFLG